MINPTLFIAIICLLMVVVIAGLWLLYYQINQKLDQTSASFFLLQQNNQSKDILQRKLQAYERLSLLLERIQYPNVIKRCYGSDLTVPELINRMKMDISAEYEHNITQQIYVSDQLWEIIQLTKEDSINILNDVGADLESYQSDQVFIQALTDKLNQRKFNPIDQAQLAIRTEVKSIL